MTGPGLLLIAHGTRHPAGAAEMDELLALLRREHRGPVAAGWLEEFATPGVHEAVAQLVAEGVVEAGCVPLLHFAAYHATSDVPRQLGEALAAHPGLSVRVGEVLGLHPALLRLAEARVRAVSEDAGHEVLIVAASGSSNARANSDVAKAARLLAEASGHRWVEPCFAGATWPRVDEVVRRVAAAGARRAVLFSWSLLAGLLEERVRDDAQAAAQRHGLELALAGRFGPHPLLAEAVLGRFAEALAAPAAAAPSPRDARP